MQKNPRWDLLRHARQHAKDRNIQRQSTPLRVLVGHIRYIHHQPHHDSCRLYGNSGCHHLQPRQPCHYHLSLSLTFRRLHDTGRSGWFVGIPFIISMIGLVAIIYGILSMDINIFELIETPDMLSQEIIENMSNSTSMNIMAGSLLFIISGLLSIVVFVFCCLDSKPGTNKYGESPKYVEEV